MVTAKSARVLIVVSLAAVLSVMEGSTQALRTTAVLLNVPVALDKTFGLKIPDPATAKEVLASVNSMATAVRKHCSPG